MKMFKTIVLSLIAFFIFTNNAFADGATITPLKKGQIAPYDGNLLSPAAVASVIAQLDVIPAQIKLETDKVKTQEKAQCEFTLSELKANFETENKIQKARIDQQLKSIQVLQDELAKKEKEKPNTTMWTTLGVTGGLIIGIGITAVIASAVK
jgi:hypothetical protein